MRWIWIDRILELEPATRCVAIKCVSLAEDVLHDHFPATDDHPATPVLPHPLIIEGFAQTAGILVGHTGGFKEKVILAKIGKATFSAVARPGCVLRFIADLERFDESGASAAGVVQRYDPATDQTVELARIEMMFSHVDRNRAGVAFPSHNFVFTEQFMALVREGGFLPPAPDAD